ncbi:hypothetical protein KSP39_PZI002731 [Platanthera zijinensis]|uniref:Uncharacterized protein n=1 Tax=Platanthera zijinensis TaxID=2320716 RepID=A0AAP0C047_9ASPA
METRLVAAEGRASSSAPLPDAPRPEDDPHWVVKRSRLFWEERSSPNREIARAAGNIILARLMINGQLVEGEKQLTVDELIPKLLVEEPTSPDHVSSSTSGSSRSGSGSDINIHSVARDEASLGGGGANWCIIGGLSLIEGDYTFDAEFSLDSGKL